MPATAQPVPDLFGPSPAPLPPLDADSYAELVAGIDAAVDAGCSLCMEDLLPDVRAALVAYCSANHLQLPLPTLENPCL